MPNERVQAAPFWPALRGACLMLFLDVPETLLQGCSMATVTPELIKRVQLTGHSCALEVFWRDSFGIGAR